MTPILKRLSTPIFLALTPALGLPAFAQGRELEAMRFQQLQMHRMNMWQDRMAFENARRAALAKQMQASSVLNLKDTLPELPKITTPAWVINTTRQGTLFPLVDGGQGLLQVPRYGSQDVQPPRGPWEDLICLDLVTGKPIWKIPVTQDLGTWPIFFDDLVIYETSDLQLIGLNRKDGSKRYCVRLDTLRDLSDQIDGPEIPFPVRIGNHLFAATTGKGKTGEITGRLHCLDPKTGEKIWSQDLESGATRVPILFEDLLIVGCNKWLYAIKAVDGTVAWKTHIGHRGIVNLDLLSNERIFLQNGHDDLHVFEARTGKTIWSLHLGPGAYTQGNGGHLFYTRDEDSFLGFPTGWAVGLDPSSGKQTWATKLGTSTVGFWMGLWIQNGSAFLRRKDDILALDLSEGKIRWRITIPETVKGTPLPSGNLLLVPARSWGKTVIHALRQEDGQDAWTYTIKEGIEDGIYFGNPEGILLTCSGGKIMCLK